MARFNEILVGRYSRSLQKLLGIKGGAPAPVFSTELGAHFHLLHGRETHFHQGWSLYGNSIQIPANVGFISQAKLRNPAGSNVIIVVEKILLVAVTTGQEVDVSIAAATATDLTSFPATIPIDSRQGIQGSTGIFSWSNSIGNASLLVILRAFIPPNDQRDVILKDHEEILILPGGGLALTGNLAGQQLNLSMLWRERFLEEPERT